MTMLPSLAEKILAQVLLPRPFDKAFTYEFKDVPKLGSWVEVPFGSSKLLGVVWKNHEGEGLDIARLKPVFCVLDAPPMDVAQLKLLSRIAHETMMPLGAALRLAMPPRDALYPKATQTRLFRTLLPQETRLTARQHLVLDQMGDEEWEPNDLLGVEGASAGIISALVKRGAVIREKRVPHATVSPYRPVATTLNAEQAEVVRGIEVALTRGETESFLLDGVTGSGKTHVYFAAIERALAANKQVLWLVPEIALTDQLRDRFTAHFCTPPLIWHSDAGPKAKAWAWRVAARGEACVVLGARSALHCNFTNLGLLIVDEEHEQAFKQTDMGAYHARDMAEHRAKLSKAVFLMGSATPSLESEHRARIGEVRRLILRQRHGVASPPQISLLDLRRTPPKKGHWLAPALINQVHETLNQGHQGILFLNRRGYAPLSLCSNCGYRVDCHQCSAWMVEHRFLDTLQCHLCGTSAPKPDKCPACEAEDSFVPCGPGIERVMEEAAKIFPSARIGVFSSDTLRDAAETRAAFDAVAAGQFNLLIGTQVLAKGLDFPKLALVGVIDADLGLSNEDLRAGERTFQLLHQVAGRAGRGEVSGRAILQTRAPESALMQALASHDRAGFFDMELRRRKAFFHATLFTFGRASYC